MSILIGIILALVIVAAVIIIILKLQCVRNEDIEHKNRQKVNTSSGGTVGIDRRNSGSLVALSDKGGKYRYMCIYMCIKQKLIKLFPHLSLKNLVYIIFGIR